MEDLNQAMLTRRDQAVEAAQRAGQRLTRLLGTDEPDLAAAIAETLQRRAYARWWTTLLDHIDEGGTDPTTALADARTTAHDALLTPANTSQRLPLRHRRGDHRHRGHPRLLPRHRHPHDRPRLPEHHRPALRPARRLGRGNACKKGPEAR